MIPRLFWLNFMPFGSCARLMLLAKSGIHAIQVWWTAENLVFQHTGGRKNDFASSITFGDASSGSWIEWKQGSGRAPESWLSGTTAQLARPFGPPSLQVRKRLKSVPSVDTIRRRDTPQCYAFQCPAGTADNLTERTPPLSIVENRRTVEDPP